MEGRNFFGDSNSGEFHGGSGSSSLRREEKASPSEFWRRLKSQVAAAAPTAVRSDRVHRVVPHNPTYPVASINQLQEGRRVQSPYYQSSVPLSFFCATPGTSLTGRQRVKEGMRMGSPYYFSSQLCCSMPPTSVRPWTDSYEFLRPQGIRMEDLTLPLMPGSSSSSSSSSHTFRVKSLVPSGFYFPQNPKMGVGSEDENGCDLQLRLSTWWSNGESVSDAQRRNQKPRVHTRLLLGQEAEEEGGHKNKKARTDSLSSGSAAAGSSSGEEIDLELRLSL